MWRLLPVFLSAALPTPLFPSLRSDLPSCVCRHTTLRGLSNLAQGEDEAFERPRYAAGWWLRGDHDDACSVMLATITSHTAGSKPVRTCCLTNTTTYGGTLAIVYPLLACEAIHANLGSMHICPPIRLSQNIHTSVPRKASSADSLYSNRMCGTTFLTNTTLAPTAQPQ
jgi:hypothetical protein